jgi:hypothetical protein
VGVPADRARLTEHGYMDEPALRIGGLGAESVLVGGRGRPDE